ncbi:ISL3 family transposase, partial [Rhodococcus aetherivorans]
MQVADRWHLWLGLIGVVEKTAIRHRKGLSTPAAPPDGTEKIRRRGHHRGTRRQIGDPDPRTARRRTRTARPGRIDLGISRQLNLDHRTVRRFVHATDIDELLATSFDGRNDAAHWHETYLRERAAAGCTDAARLTREITERGYRGNAQTVR